MPFHSLYPKRIVCLSHDAVETLIALGAEARIVGRPSGCRKDILRDVESVGGYGNIDADRVRALNPDLVIAYSECHRNVVEGLVAAHINVLALGHTDLDGIYKSILMIGGATGYTAQAESLVQTLKARILEISSEGDGRKRPRVYFEEWPDPPTCGTRWISQLIEAAGGEDIFTDRAYPPSFRDRSVLPSEVVSANPDFIFASWCGKKLDQDALSARPGWQDIEAVRRGRIFEIPGDEILQPGPRIVEGLLRFTRIFGEHGDTI